MIFSLKLNETFNIEEEYLINNLYCNEEKYDLIFNNKVNYLPVDYSIFAFDIECFIPKSGAFPNGYNFLTSSSKDFSNTILNN
jgi:hypothetical protein